MKWFPAPALAIFFLLTQPGAFAQVTNSGMTAVFDPQQNIVKLKWLHTDTRITRFVLQKSSDELSWADIYDLPVKGPAKTSLIKYNDTKTGPGKNYYRLKMYTGAAYSFTDAVMVIVGQAGSGWLMYPVPVGSTLTLQYNGTTPVTGVISIIIQGLASGTVFTRLRVVSNTRLIQIPVGNLGRGTYDIRIYINNQVVWNQRFIK